MGRTLRPCGADPWTDLRCRVRGRVKLISRRSLPLLAVIWLVTGPPGAGKSTLVSRVVLRLKSAGVIVGGCSTGERRSNGRRTGFEVKDLTTGSVGTLATAAGGLGPKVGKYRVNLNDLSKVGAAGLLKAAEISEVIVIDEVGPMELVSPEFRRAVGACVESGKPLLAVVHERLDDDLLNELRENAAKSVSLTPENRIEAAEEVASEILTSMGLRR